MLTGWSDQQTTYVLVFTQYVIITIVPDKPANKAIYDFIVAQLSESGTIETHDPATMTFQNLPPEKRVARPPVMYVLPDGSKVQALTYTDTRIVPDHNLDVTLILGYSSPNEDREVVEAKQAELLNMARAACDHADVRCEITTRYMHNDP